MVLIQNSISSKSDIFQTLLLALNLKTQTYSKLTYLPGNLQYSLEVALILNMHQNIVHLIIFLNLISASPVSFLMTIFYLDSKV